MKYVCMILFVIAVVTLCLYLVERHKRRRDMILLKKYIGRLIDGDLSEGFDYELNWDSRQLYQDLDYVRQLLHAKVGDSIKDERLMQEMLISIAHDLKTPITSIKGYVEGLMDGVCDGNPEREEKYLRTIRNKSEDMNRLLDSLMLYVRLGMKAVTYDFKNVNAKAFLDEYVLELKNELEDSGIEFQYENLLTDEKISVDVLYFKRVLDNLVSNAKKSLGDRKLVKIKAFGEEKTVGISVIDTGCGIAAKDIPLIFDRFYRGNSARTNPEKGNGVGLAIVKKIITDHNGKVWVESEPGKGTSVNILLRRI